MLRGGRHRQCHDFLAKANFIFFLFSFSSNSYPFFHFFFSKDCNVFCFFHSLACKGSLKDACDLIDVRNPAQARTRSIRTRTNPRGP